MHIRDGGKSGAEDLRMRDNLLQLTCEDFLVEADRFNLKRKVTPMYRSAVAGSRRTQAQSLG
jgi:hypothetical protein